VTRRDVVIAVLVALAGVADATAQAPDPANQLEAGIKQTVARIQAERARTGRSPGLLLNDAQLFILGLTVPTEDLMLAHAEEGRTDKQLGADGGAAGTTSLVTKGGIPRVLAVAVENGALDQTQSGTTVTLRGSPMGLARALANKGYLATYVEGDPALNVLQRFSFGVSFDTSRGQTPGAVPTLTAKAQQLSSITGRLTILDHREPRRAQYDDRWNDFAAVQQGITSAAVSFFAAAKEDPAIGAWLQRANAAIAAASSDRLESVLRRQLARLPALSISSATLDAVTMARARYDELLEARAAVLAEVDRGSQLVLDYTNDRPAEGHDTSNIRIVASVGGVVNVTANASATFYNRTPPAGVTARGRDVSGALQLDIPFGRPDGIGRFVLSLSGKYESLLSDVPGPAGFLLSGTKGSIGLGQIKLTIPVKNAAVKMPLSLTVASRSEFVKQRVVRANVGMSYDLDAVFARFKP